MAKTPMLRSDLQARALAEIRQQPGCSSVDEIAVNSVADERAENNWSLCVVSAGAADAKLQQSGVISFARGRIQIVDREALETLSCECYKSLLDQSATLGRHRGHVR